MNTKKIYILGPILILLLIFISLIIQSTYNKYAHYNTVIKQDAKVSLIMKISNLIYELQLERGMSAGYISGNGRDFKKLLYKQRKETDNNVKVLENLIYKEKTILQTDFFKNYFSNDKYLSNKILNYRKMLNKHTISTENTISNYTDTISDLLKLAIQVLNSSSFSHITKKMNAYIFFLHANEKAGLERAYTTTLLSSEVNKNKILNIYNLINEQKLYTNLSLELCDDDFVKYYNASAQGKSFKKIDTIRELLFDYNIEEIKKIKPKELFLVSTQKIEKIISISKKLSDLAIEYTKHDVIDAKHSLIKYTVLNILASAIFLYMIYLLFKLIRNEEKLKIYIDKQVISSVTDTKGIITDVSEAFCNISGYTRAELIGKPHNIVRHPDMPKESFHDMWKNIADGNIWSGNVQNLKKNGDYYWVSAEINPIRNNFGQTTAYLAIRHDITAQVKIAEMNDDLEDKIKEAVNENKIQHQKMLQQSRLAQMGEMISMIAHQWRQPLNAISLTASNLSFQCMLDNMQADFFQKELTLIDDYSQHLSKTIDDFRNFFKNDNKAEVSSLEKIINETLSIINTSVETNNIKLTHKSVNSVEFETYPSEIKQVILNLIKNAEDALLEHEVKDPVIEIYVDKFSVSIKDNAGGISEEIIENIFDPYFSTKKEKDGTGLGLYMSKVIIEDHCSGTINVENIDDGVVFTIDLQQKEV